MDKIILYTTHCPKCEILENKLISAQVEYEICTDVKLMISKGFMSAPILEVNNKSMTYLEAINWVKEI